MRISQAKAIVEASIDSQTKHANGRDAQRPIPYLVGGAGLGKTSVVQSIANERGIGLNILSLAQYDAGELAGWLVADGDSMKRLRPDWMPADGEGILFLDELAQAPVADQNIASQLVNERRIGEHRLPDGWAIVCAGNRTSDRAGTNNMPSHLKDRLLFLEVEAHLEDTVRYMNSVGVSPLVTGFLRFRPELLHKFDRDANSCPSPRSWERVDTMMKWGLDAVDQQEAVAGQVGRGACAEFMGYKAIHDTVPDIDAVIASPDTAPISEDPAVCYAVSAALAYKANDKNIGNVIKYLKRLPHKEFAVFAIKDAYNRHPAIKQTQPFREYLMSDGKDLML
jgi:hypothetical protein